MSQLEAYVLTLVLEVLVVLSVLYRYPTIAHEDYRGSTWWIRGIILAIIASTMTHPLVWWFNENWAQSSASGWALRLAILEVSAVVVESLVYRFGLRCSWTQAFLLSFAANAFSFFFGWLVWQSLFHPER